MAKKAKQEDEDDKKKPVAKSHSKSLISSIFGNKGKEKR
jgi:hypothetical protein